MPLSDPCRHIRTFCGWLASMFPHRVWTRITTSGRTGMAYKTSSYGRVVVYATRGGHR